MLKKNSDLGTEKSYSDVQRAASSIADIVLKCDARRDGDPKRKIL